MSRIRRLAIVLLTTAVSLALTAAPALAGWRSP